MQQLLKNPGFEEGKPNDWDTYATGTTHKYIYPEIGRNCYDSSVAIERPAREEGRNAAWVQNIDISPPRKYKLSGHIKAQNIVGNGASIKVDWKDINGRYLGTSTIMAPIVGTTDWKYFEGNITPNSGAIRATIVLELGDSSGKVLFDDISFDEEEGGDGPIPPGYKLVFEDNFDGTSLDTTKWTHTYGSIALQNSNLILGVSNNGGEIRGCIWDYTNKRCTGVKYQLKYGYIEYRAKLADTGNNRGYCNQLWFVDSPGQSHHDEVDITETATGPEVPNRPETGINTLNTTVHANRYPADKWYRATKTKITKTVDLSKDYHVYACEWAPDFVRFIFDGQEVFKVVASEIHIPDLNMYLIVGLCKRPVTTDPAQCWPATEPGSVPAKIYIDYIKVYQKG